MEAKIIAQFIDAMLNKGAFPNLTVEDWAEFIKLARDVIDELWGDNKQQDAPKIDQDKRSDKE